MSSNVYQFLVLDACARYLSLVTQLQLEAPSSSFKILIANVENADILSLSVTANGDDCTLAVLERSTRDRIPRKDIMSIGRGS